VLRNQIAIRKATGALERATSPGELWECFTALMNQLGFAEARCAVRGADGTLSHEFEWRCASPPRGPESVTRHPGHDGALLWALEIPLAGAGGTRGIVRLGRSFDRRAPLFRMQSLVELISGSFSAALMAHLQGSPLEAPAPVPLPLAASLKAAAGLRR